MKLKRTLAIVLSLVILLGMMPASYASFGVTVPPVGDGGIIDGVLGEIGGSIDGVLGEVGGTIDGVLGEIGGGNGVNGDSVVTPHEHAFVGGVCSDCGESVLGEEWIAPNFAEGDYTMIAIPDTQAMVKYWPEEYTAQMQWIADNKDSLNIQAVLHMGDMVQEDSNIQWNTAKEGTDLLDEAGVVWMPMRGNHDNSDMFNSAYPYDTYGVGRSYFGGSYKEGKLDHYYCFISAGDREYVIINLGWMPTVDVLKWAKNIVAANSDKNVIISCHAYMNNDGTPLSWETDMSDDIKNELLANLPEGVTLEMAMDIVPDGDAIWAAFKDYENVVLALSGHVHSADIVKFTAKNGAGKNVSSLLIDRQYDEIDQPLGMLAILSFSAVSDKVSVNWYSTEYDAFYKASNQFDIIVPHVSNGNEHVHAYVKDKVVEPGCTNDGYTTYICSCGAEEKSGVTTALGHSEEALPALEPTCTEAGLTEGSKCSRCGEVFLAQTTVEALGHDAVKTEAVAPDCENTGLTEGSKCSRCDEVFTPQEIVAALGHKWSNVKVTKEPTAKEEGERTYTCADCGDTMAEPIEKLPDCKGKHKWDKGETVKEPTTKADGEKRYTCYICGETKTEKIQRLPDVSAFKDVSQKAYYYDSVKWAVESGITTGTASNAFSPSRICTRAQVVTFLWRAAGEPIARNTSNPFADVAEGEYYYDAVLWALENGITGGISSDLFAPDAPCTRAQVTTFIWRAAGQPKPEGNKNPFGDVAEGQYYYDAVIWAVEMGVTKGTTLNSFAPDQSCTRAQIVTFLWRAFSL